MGLFSRVLICVNIIDMQILIKTDVLLEPADIEVFADSDPVDFTVDKDTVVLNLPLDYGFHLLKIIQKTEQRITFLDVIVDGSSLRSLIYMSYGISTTRELEYPATVLYKVGMQWVLPFVAPVTAWIDIVLSKIPSRTLGSTLYKDYDLYYPDALKISSTYPRPVCDFFSKNFNITVVPKQDKQMTPVVDVTLEFNNSQAILDRVLSSADSFEKFLSTGKSDSVNIVDDPGYQPLTWRYYRLADKGIFNVSYEEFPELYDFFERNNITKIHSVFIAFLEPKSYVYPHRDPARPAEFAGASNLYVPLNFSQGNWFRVCNVGTFSLVPDQIRAFNIDKYTHGVINDTDKLRISLIVTCVIPDSLLTTNSCARYLLAH
jgi:hypothetical protein